ncbi:MAG: TlpA disulfide reductase family protein [Pirellulaceae bacterium]
MTFIGQGKFTWMHEMEATREMAQREFGSRDELVQWLNESATAEQRLQLECDFWYLHQDNLHPHNLVEFTDYEEVEPGVVIPMTEWSASWMHEGKQYQYNISHTVVREAKADVDLKPLVTASLPKRGDEINDWRHVTHVKYEFDPDMPEAAIHALVDKAQIERLENQRAIDAILKPLKDMVGKPAPKLTGQPISKSKPEIIPGKRVLLHFWATWCEPCKNDIPLLNEMVEKNWNIIGVHAPGTDAEEIKAAIKDLEIKYPVLLPSETNGSAMTPDRITGYPVQMFPCCVLIDKDGNVEAIGTLKEVLTLNPKSRKRN